MAMAEDERDQRLRKKAEKLLGIELATLESVTPDQMRHLVHELQVHQIELQMQNEELRSVQDELERSRKKYFELYDLAPAAYLTLDVDGVILEANLRTADLLGHPRSHVLKRNFRDFVVSSDWVPFAEHLRETATTDGRRTCDLELVRRDRSPVFGHLETVRMSVEEKEGAWELRTSITDITERKRTEARARDGELFARKINESSLNGIYIYNIEREELVYINHECERLTGYTPAGLPAMRGEAFFSLFLPEDRSRVREYIIQVSQAGDEETREIECRVKTADDRWIWCLSRNAVFDRDKEGKARSIIGSFLDVTERKEVEEALRENQARLETVFTAIPYAIVEYDTNLKPVRANEIAMKAAGFTSLNFTRDEAAVKLKFKRLDGSAVRTEDLPTSRALRGETVVEDEYVTTDAEGIERVISAYAVPLYQNGKIKSVIAVWDDITKRQRAEEALRQANEQLEERVRERTAELVALNRDLMESRDQLRSLTTELVVTEARERRALASELHDTVAQTLAVAKMRLKSMRAGGGSEGKSAEEVKGIVTLIEQANRETRSLMSDFSLPLLYEDGLEAALRALARRMEELHSLAVDVVDDGNPKPLSEDYRIVVFRAVQELLTNAVKHAKATRVTVSLRREKRTARIEVKDDGVGFLASEVRSGSAKGERYGLFSIQERMQHLGGRFEVVSRPGEGVRAVLVTPLRVKEDEKAAPSRVRIVIADDHQLMRDGLRGFLEKEPGFEIVGEAANGLEAVHRSHEAKPDVVIMDINMPVMDGIEATRQIKQALPEVQVIGLTAYGEDPIASRVLDAGASSVVLKGSSAEALSEAIRIALKSDKGN
jgi:PAS domain S-box-containing protein